MLCVRLRQTHLLVHDQKGQKFVLNTEVPENWAMEDHVTSCSYQMVFSRGRGQAQLSFQGFRLCLFPTILTTLWSYGRRTLAKLPTQIRASITQILLPGMSREAYAPPSLTGQSSSFGGAAAASTGDGPQVLYLCGECNSKVGLVKGEPIRCKECGHRVLYKERTKR